mmetsp:Transcript_65228/g.211210  ORF Transcript_65228/g.211210 Transcript_65228/m.211210 type:complete len:95 (-) Transcript_65228:39-323(-)
MTAGHVDAQILLLCDDCSKRCQESARRLMLSASAWIVAVLLSPDEAVAAVARSVALLGGPSGRGAASGGTRRTSGKGEGDEGEESEEEEEEEPC